MQEQLPRMLAEEPTGTYSWRVSEVVTYPVMRGLAQPFFAAKEYYLSNKLFKCTPSRCVKANRVKVGLAHPPVGNTELPAMWRL